MNLDVLLRLKAIQLIQQFQHGTLYFTVAYKHTHHSVRNPLSSDIHTCSSSHTLSQAISSTERLIQVLQIQPLLTFVMVLFFKFYPV